MFSVNHRHGSLDFIIRTGRNIYEYFSINVIIYFMSSPALSTRVVSFHPNLIFNLENISRRFFSSRIVYGFWKRDPLDVFEDVRN